MTDRVLLPVNAHPPWARRAARALADMEDPDEARATLLYVFDAGERAATAEATVEEGSVDDLARVKSGVTTSVETLEAANFDVDVRGIEAEDHGNAILRTAREASADRIYLFNRNRSPVGKAVFGSAVQEVLTRATVPVVVLPP